jgi:hypothetical protein
MINNQPKGMIMHINDIATTATRIIELHHLTPSTTRAHRLAMISRHAPHASRMTRLRILTRIEQLLER